jgi:hypothetical protein
MVTQQRVSHTVFDHLTDGLTPLGGAPAHLVEQVIVNRDRGSHTSQHINGAS